MKSQTVIFIIVSIIALSTIAEAHRRKHGRRHSTSTTLTLRSCASKLDFLCLGRLWNQLENYKSNVSYIISDLQDRVEERFDQFEIDRRTSELNRRLNILDNARWLTVVIYEFMYNQTDTDIEACLQKQLPVIIQFRDNMLAAVDTCISASDSAFNRTATRNRISTLNSTALDVEDKLCNCVEHIHVCSTKSEKQTAKGCAEVAAASINYDLIQQQADTIYNDVNAQAVTALANVRTCLTNVPVLLTRTNIVNDIQKCVPT